MNDPSNLDPSDEELVAAYALDALDEDEAAQAEALLATSRLAASLEARMRLAAAELAGATAGDRDTTPPDELRQRTLAAARAERSPAPITPTDATVVHRIELQRLLQLLDRLEPADWTRRVDPPELAGFTVHDLVAHVAGSEAMFAQQLGLDTPAIPETDSANDARTEAVVARHRSLRPEQTVIELESLAVLVDRHVSSLDDAELDTTIEWWGTPLTISQVLLHRSFEIWTHHDDIRRAADIAQSAPPPGSLLSMSTLAAGWAALFLQTVDAAAPGEAARIDLTGDGGGSHLVPLGAAPIAPDATPRFTLTMDVIDFCRAVGNRVPPQGHPYDASGDTQLAATLVGALTNLAGI